ncbi:hypothetical protein CASFOL_032868 [Castilleja foliolosa]|uniref:Chlororespiratory reduction 7 n=1 Tax=Castilleja foliolosa TaxID=1961234 RepID=A0ABD3C3B9_9LAMI
MILLPHPLLSLKALMEGTLPKLNLQAFLSAFGPHLITQNTHFPVVLSESKAQTNQEWPKVNYRSRQIKDNLLKVSSSRRRRANIESDTYVLMEPGKNEEFVTEDELRDRLKGWLENWPSPALPPDLAKFDTTDDIVQYLVKSVCELELDDDVGSVQWYQVRLD